ncbi:hypothetical protein [Clostridium acetobutylicum]|nr:hypothetical protein [Clostridium acetobutylicum]MBC2583252.1 hypothetical protein [Clostridium acetobutylicum]
MTDLYTILSIISNKFRVLLLGTKESAALIAVPTSPTTVCAPSKTVPVF